MDREKVITHLQFIRTWAEFDRERDLQFFTAKHLEDIAKWADDAIVLLNEQNDCENCAMAIEDRQMVVRCKDCKHKEESVSPSWEAWCNRLHCGCDNDWYCADGERQGRSVK